MKRTSFALVLALSAFGVGLVAQERPMSPTGTAAVQVGGKWVKPASGRGAPTLGGETYQGGQWIEVTYGRPLRRGRELWGSGADYGKAALVGTPIWRAGANVSTRLRSEVPLVLGGTTVASGEYSLFIDLKPNNWTLVVSSWGALQKYDPKDKTGLWGSYFYTPDRDVVRVPMKLETLPHSHEQLTWAFIDMTETGGSLAITWDRQMASVPFTVGK